MERIVGLLFLLILSGCTSSALFFVNSLARFSEYTVYENISYGNHPLNQLDIYVPGEQSNRSGSALAVVIYFYGGCWGGCESLEKDKYVFVAEALTSHNYIAILADYRRYPEVKFAQLMDDARKSVEWVRSNVYRYGGNPDTIFLMGHSSGAHMAVMLSLDETYLQAQTYESIKGFVGLAGPYDFLPFTKPYQKILFGPEQNYQQSQPVNFVNGNEPPLLLLYGNEDQTVYPHNIINLTDKVQQVGGQVEAHLYNDIDHFSILGALSKPYQKQQPILNDIICFLNRHIEKGSIKNLETLGC